MHVGKECMRQTTFKCVNVRVHMQVEYVYTWGRGTRAPRYNGQQQQDRDGQGQTTGINPLKYAGRESRDREHLHLLSFSCCCLWGPEAEIKTGNREDERMKRLWSRVPRWRQVWKAENRQEMARAARGPPLASKAGQVVPLPLSP